MTTYTPKAGTIYIVGAGPGAPDLIAVRGRDIIAQADLVLYADSLVEHSVAEIAGKPDAEILPSSGLHLEEMVQRMVDAAKAGKVVARVHSGDPTLYGAVHEQMALFEDHEVPYEVVPGITAAFAAAAQLKVELTIPDLVQTIILTRTAGRTTMPERENLIRLASTGASLAIYLSVTRIKKVIADLLSSGGYTPETPCAVLHKTTWPDESHVIGTLDDIAAKVRQAGYTKHALILVSPALDQGLKGEDRRTSSHLYDKSYTHRFRKAADFTRGKEKAEAKEVLPGIVRGEKHLGAKANGSSKRDGTVVISVTKNGSALAEKLAAELGGNAMLPEKFASEDGYDTSVLSVVRQQWVGNANLVLVMPTGVASRAIAPLLQHKSTDPAVVCLDEAGQFIIPLLGGHQAGANELATRIAEFTGGQAAITTASDVQEKPALDLLGNDSKADSLLGQANSWHIDAGSAVTHTSAALVNDELIGLYIADGLDASDTLAPLLACDNVEQVPTLDILDLDNYAGGIIVSHEAISDHHRHLLNKSILYRPAVLVVGIGCKRGVAQAVLQGALSETLKEAGLSADSIVSLSTADLKADESGLQALAQSLNVPLNIVSSETLAEMDADAFSPSAAQEKFGIAGVAEPTAVHISAGTLIVPKQRFETCTVAVALKGN